MIQRIQTLFLAIAAIAIMLMFFFPFASITEFTDIQSEILETDYYKMSVMGIEDPSPDTIPQINLMVHLPVLVLTSIIFIIIISSILRYKNRKQQMNFVKITFFLNIIMVAGIFLNYQKLFSSGVISIELEMGAYLPLISLVFLIVANRYILKDEKLIKSVDRLR
jgi:hypothetical protein